MVDVADTACHFAEFAGFGVIRGGLGRSFVRCRKTFTEGRMSWKHGVAVAVVALGLIGSPAVRAEVPAPALWDGTVLGADGRPAGAEIVAYARPSGLGLDEGSAPLREIARTRADGAGRYVLRSLHTDALRAAQDQDGWTNVMVAAFGDDGSFNLAFDSVSWVPAGGFSAAGADRPNSDRRGRWVTTPAERLAAERGEIRALSADADEDPAQVAMERPTKMVLSGHGERGVSAQGAPKPSKPADRNCMALLESKDLDVHFTKVGEVHADRQWGGFFQYSTTRSTSFQVGVRQGGGWAVGGSTSSLQNSQATTTSAARLAPQQMYHFAADLKYGWYKWKCYSRDRWYEGESIQPYTWKGGLRQTEGGNEPGCDPARRSPIPPGGVHKRDEKRSTTYGGGVSVAGFSGSVTTTIARGVRTEWFNEASRERWLCGESANIGDTAPTRIRSLP
ncbi:MAG TPA: hypothetical protein VFS16_05890 [Acidimicrobiia bacterium]|nr:hypothetical protein [Acidimicrobiia bacterium]